MKVQDYISVKDAADKWDVSVRQVQIWCKNGKIKDVLLFGKSWAIPTDTLKPTRTVKEKPGRKPRLGNES